MKVLLYGGNGWIGNKIKNILKNKNIQFQISSLHILPESIQEIKKEILDCNPTHIISSLGRTCGIINDEAIHTIDYLEYPGKLKENINDNLFAPLLLALFCKDRNIHLTYLGTGCIFTGDSKYKFTEDDLPNFFGSSYSTVKGYTDILMHEFDNVFNIRIRMPISSEMHHKEFITKITTYTNICSIPNSMTVLDELLPVMIDLMTKNTTGTLNLVNPDVISHNDILNLYKQYINPTHKWNSISYDEQMKFIKSHRSNNHLDTSKLESLVNIKDIRTSVENIIYNRKKKLL